MDGHSRAQQPELPVGLSGPPGELQRPPVPDGSPAGSTAAHQCPYGYVRWERKDGPRAERGDGRNGARDAPHQGAEQTNTAQPERPPG